MRKILLAILATASLLAAARAQGAPRRVMLLAAIYATSKMQALGL